MAWSSDRLMDLLWQMFYCHFMKPNDLNSAQRNLNQFFPKDMLIKCCRNFEIILILVIFEQGKNVKLSFVDIEVFREKGKFVTTVNRKPTFRSVYTHFESLFPTVYKSGMAYTLAWCCFKICSDWTKFYEKLFPLSFIDN